MTPTQNTRPNRITPTKSGNPGGNVLIIGLCATGVFLLVAATVWLFTGKTVTGTEFCPQTFQIRRFEYRRYPLVGTALSKLTLSTAKLSVTTSVLQHLRTVPASKWDVVDVTESSHTDIRSPAILINSLGTFWDQWSDEHPDLARVLWPDIQLVAIQGNYAKIPEMLETALLELSAIELRDKLTLIREKEESFGTDSYP